MDQPISHLVLPVALPVTRGPFSAAPSVTEAQVVRRRENSGQAVVLLISLVWSVLWNIHLTKCVGFSSFCMTEMCRLNKPRRENGFIG